MRIGWMTILAATLASHAAAQVVVERGGSAQELAAAVMPPGVTITAAEVEGFYFEPGSAANYGLFVAGSAGYGLAGSGIVLGSGDVAAMSTPVHACDGGSWQPQSVGYGQATLAQRERLDRILPSPYPGTWLDCAELRVEFTIATASMLEFELVFASEEFPEFGVCPPDSSPAYGDAVGVFLDGVNVAGAPTEADGMTPLAVGHPSFCMTVERDAVPGCPVAFRDPDPYSMCYQFNTNCISGVLMINGKAWVTVRVPVTEPGTHELIFMVADRSDSIRDSFALVRRGRVATPCAADFNDDGFVDDIDFGIFVGFYEQRTAPAGCPADLNGDGLVDDFDFAMFAPAYNQYRCE